MMRSLDPRTRGSLADLFMAMLEVRAGKGGGLAQRSMSLETLLANRRFSPCPVVPRSLSLRGWPA